MVIVFAYELITLYQYAHSTYHSPKQSPNNRDVLYDIPRNKGLTIGPFSCQDLNKLHKLSDQDSTLYNRLFMILPKNIITQTRAEITIVFYLRLKLSSLKCLFQKFTAGKKSYCSELIVFLRLAAMNNPPKLNSTC